jgi:parvulin-like peptidyl-prolyl isomerase
MLATEAQKLQPGQISGPIEVEGHIFIMKLEDKRSKSYEPFEQVQKELEGKIISDRRQKAFEKLNAELVLDEKDAFLDFCLEKIYRMNKQ